MARSLDQILSEVTARSDPQRQTVLNQIADLPNQQAAQTAAIGAQKDQANEDILSSARQRGLGFSGIPLGEQAKYAATTYAPALANLGTSFNNQKGTLESALSQIGQNDYTTANDIFNKDRTFEEQQREFDAQQATAARAAAAQNSPFSGLFGGAMPQPPQQAPQPGPDPQTQTAYNDVQNLLGKDAARIQREYLAIKKSAGFGNAYDKIKQALIEQLYPAVKNYGNNTVALGTSQPTLVSLNPTYSGLKVGVASPGVLR